MMTVHAINTPYQFPRPDLTVLYSSRQRINDESSALGELYLPVLQEELDTLKKEISLADKTLLRALTRIPIELTSAGLSEMLKAIETLGLHSENPESADALYQLSEEVSGLINIRLDNVKRCADEMNEQMTHLKAAKLSDNLQRISHLELLNDVNTTALTAENLTLTDVALTETALTLVIDALNKQGLTAKLRPLVDSLKTLAKVDPKNPLVGSLDAAIIGVSNMLNLMEAAANYGDLIEARDRVQQQAGELRTRVAALEDKAKTSVDRIQQLMTLNSFQGLKVRYVQEGSKLPEALIQFVNSVQVDASEPLAQRAQRFSIQAAALTHYLQALHRDWRS